jgi:hypothetical protein
MFSRIWWVVRLSEEGSVVTNGHILVVHVFQEIGIVTSIETQFNFLFENVHFFYLYY